MTAAPRSEDLSDAAFRAVDPTTAEAVLAQVEPFRCRLYQEVRSILDSLEDAAPWYDLYYPPDDLVAFLSFQETFLALVDAIPGRLAGVIAALLAEHPAPPEGGEGPEDEVRATLEEAEFFFQGIERMVSHDVGRLRQRLDGVKQFGAEAAVAQRERIYLSELTAELKGKYASALMGATASLVGEGRWSGVEAEELLFPEKQAEHERNRELLDTLELVLLGTESLAERVELRDLRERWLAGERSDQYALTDLVAFRGLLGQLLKRRRRRALYSGDYHEIQRRERRLLGLLTEMETLHQRTWSATGSASLGPAGERLAALCLEVAALIDVQVLEEMVGERALADLRSIVVRERERSDAGEEEPDERLRQGVDEELRPVIALLHDDDLRTLLQLLLGSVRKRGSFSREGPAGAAEPAPELPPAVAPYQPPEAEVPAPESSVVAPPPAEAEPSLDMELPAAAIESPVLPTAPPALEVEPPAAEAEPLPLPTPFPTPRPAATQTLSSASLAAASEEQQEATADLHRLLVEVQSPQHPDRRSVDLLKRLLSKHSRVPPSMLQGSHGYFFDLMNRLVPELERVAGFGVIPADSRHRLVEYCLSLSRAGLTPEQMEEEVPQALQRLDRLLQALTAATA